MIIINFLNYKLNLNFLFLIYFYVITLCWPLKFGNLKLYEIISILIIGFFLYKNFLKTSFNIFASLILLLFIIFLSWAVNWSTLPLDDNMGFGLQSPGLFHAARLFQLLLCFGIFYLFYSLRDRELISKLINFYIHCFPLYVALGYFLLNYW